MAVHIVGSAAAILVTDLNPPAATRKPSGSYLNCSLAWLTKPAAIIWGRWLIWPTIKSCRLGVISSHLALVGASKLFTDANLAWLCSSVGSKKKKAFSNRSLLPARTPLLWEPAIGWPPIKVMVGGKVVAACIILCLLLPTSNTTNPALTLASLKLCISSIITDTGPANSK